MNGRPVWLASVSHRDRDGQIVPTGRWSSDVRARANALVGRALLGVGDLSREVAFRMNVTLCRHRGLTEEEEAGLPLDFHEFEATDTAGSAVELLSVRGVTGNAIRPCENPGRTPIPGAGDPDLWLPEPCGACAPCLAREAVRA